jgi:hypothetical protein
MENIELLYPNSARFCNNIRRYYIFKLKEGQKKPKEGIVNNELGNKFPVFLVFMFKEILFVYTLFIIQNGV